ncbi:sensor histidine kinase [Modestobacter sp. VKM Ac-2979]|uniref:sensor histidine kinase n=1 Tax=unclassified Modestobacter TaxID=2643866 RepID=UPI0022AB4F78|nr:MULTISPECIES: sensor histidine kinase [unclassified Modestobacter]MCZ2813238.1 sensor histidine kinase [Modestobacter sp. VKM Ac-2979]MCZ2844854.1 sensor histidine kinase [Modestobacter sp. VKM Ac-2980]
MVRSLLERAATRLRRHPFGVDVALACLVALVTVPVPGLSGYSQSSPEVSVLLGLALCAPLAWRRRNPVPAAAVVVLVCLVQLVVLSDELLLADVAAPMMVYALAAHGPAWAGRAGLGAGLLGAVLAAVSFNRGQSISLVVSTATLIGALVVGAWALGALRRTRGQDARPGRVPAASDQPLLERAAGWLRDHPFGVDAVLAGVAVLVLVTASTDIAYPGPGLAAIPLSLALLVPLAWRRRRPVRAAAVVTVASLLELVLVPGYFLPANIAAPVMVYALAAYAPRWASRAGLVVGLVGAVLASAVYFGAGTWFGFVFAAGVIGVLVVACWALGDLRRARLQQVAGLEERARLLELEREQEMRLAASTERARIAREMHDVVAHSLSVVIAQADGGRYAGQTDPAAATGALDAISATGRQALTDMRKLLGVLREGDGEEYAPQPDVAAIDQLVADVRASGLAVDLIVEGDPRPLPAGAQLAAYRIVQESLTNVLKHAGPAGRAWVRLHWRPDALELAVLDDGRGASAAIVESDGQGQGLLGMRERAALHGGRLTAGPRTGGGFGVHASLPYGPPR